MTYPRSLLDERCVIIQTERSAKGRSGLPRPAFSVCPSDYLFVGVLAQAINAIETEYCLAKLAR
jgi:hypothetical protein